MEEKIHKILLLVLTILFMISCSAPEKPMEIPDWVYQPYKDHSKNLYINAVGSGNAKNSAAKDAYDKISEIIQEDIATRQSNRQIYQEKTSARFTTNAVKSKQILNETARSLRSIEFEKTYFDEKDGVYFVLACLDREETGKIYDEEIEKNNIRI